MPARTQRLFPRFVKDLYAYPQGPSLTGSRQNPASHLDTVTRDECSHHFVHRDTGKGELIALAEVRAQRYGTLGLQDPDLNMKSKFA